MPSYVDEQIKLLIPLDAEYKSIKSRLEQIKEISSNAISFRIYHINFLRKKSEIQEKIKHYLKEAPIEDLKDLHKLNQNYETIVNAIGDYVSNKEKGRPNSSADLLNRINKPELIALIAEFDPKVANLEIFK